MAETQQLSVGQLMKTQALNQDIVIIRDSKGKVHAIDPHCPHYGAHLGSGDVVQISGEDCVRCPFHEWSFRAEDGVCVDVPYAKDRSKMIAIFFTLASKLGLTISIPLRGS